MDTIQKVVLIAHVVIALGLIVLVLLQRGKGADAGAAFGAGASGTVFGARGSGSFFSRMTAILATVFFVTSLSLAYLSSQSSTAPRSVLDNAADIEEMATEPDIDSAAASELPELDDAASDVAADSGDDLPALDDAVEETPR